MVKFRSLPFLGDAKHLKHSVQEYHNQIGGPPPLISTDDVNMQHATNLITSMVCMISHVMTKMTCPELILEVEHVIKIYLTMVHKFDLAIRKDETKKYTWVRKSNYLSLLNIPTQMSLYGPLRLYWEGGYRGEGIIQEIKGIINNGLIIGWQKHTMKRFYSYRALKLLNNECSPKMLDSKEDFGNAKLYKRYKNLQTIKDKIHNHMEISVMYGINGVYYVAVNKHESIQIMRSEFTHSYCTMDYFKWELLADVTLSTPKQNDVRSYCLLLPKIDNVDIDITTSEVVNIYCCIDSDWNELTNNQGFTRPRPVSSKDVV